MKTAPEPWKSSCEQEIPLITKKVDSQLETNIKLEKNIGEVSAMSQDGSSLLEDLV